MPIFHAVSIGEAGYEFNAPGIAPPESGCALVAASGSGSQFQLGWTARPVLQEPTIAAGSDADYLSPAGWAPIPEVDYAAVVAALGYTPVNKAGDTMSGPLTVDGNVTADYFLADGLAYYEATRIWKAGSYQIHAHGTDASAFDFGNQQLTFNQWTGSVYVLDIFGSTKAVRVRTDAGLNVYQADGTTFGTLQSGTVSVLDNGIGLRSSNVRSVGFGFLDGYPVAGSTMSFGHYGEVAALGSSGQIGWNSHSGVIGGAGPDTILKRAGAGEVGIYQADGTTHGHLRVSNVYTTNGMVTFTNGYGAIWANGDVLTSYGGNLGAYTGGTFKVLNQAGSADAPLTASAATFSGALNVTASAQSKITATTTGYTPALWVSDQNSTLGGVMYFEWRGGAVNDKVKAFICDSIGLGFYRMVDGGTSFVSSADLMITHAGLVRFRVSPTCPTVGALNAEKFGEFAAASDYGAAFGSSAFAGALSAAFGYGTTTIYESTAIGGSAVGGWRGVAIGAYATTTTFYGNGDGVAVGERAVSSHYQSIALGGRTTTTAANQLATGAASVPINNVRIHGNAAAIAFERDGGTVMSWDPSANTTFATNVQQGFNSVTPSARHRMIATGQRASEVGDGAGAWQTGYREEYNASSLRVGFYGATPLAKQTFTTGDGADALATLLHNLGLITKV